MTENKVISMIIPVYNTEQYLDMCIESVVAQTYKNLEIIIIDDGSTDSSGKICDEWAMRDSRIRVIHQSNHGLAYVRQKGLEECTGEYIAWVDSDDYINEQFIALLYQQLIDTSADISMCSFYEIYDDASETKIFSRIVNATYTREQYLDMLYTMGVASVVWNKLAKKEVYNNVSFPIGKRFEDSAVMRTVLYNCDKIVASNKPLYYYRRRNDSITLQEKGVEENANYLCEFCGWLENDITFYKSNQESHFVLLAVKLLCNTIISHFAGLSKDAKKKFKKKFRKNAKIIIFSKECKLKVKLKFVLAYFSIPIFLFVNKFGEKIYLK